MKKLTDKDAILCVSIEEAIAIKDKFNIDIKNQILKQSLKDHIEICLYQDNCFSGKRYAKDNGFKITKASKILNKFVSKKELLRRIEKLEKVVIDNTEVTVFKTPEIEGIKNELTELPEKWCIKITDENTPYLNKYLNENKDKYANYKNTWKVHNDDYYGYFKSEGLVILGHSVEDKPDGYTEITFEQFKKWVLKEDDSKPVEFDTFKNLSIREVQVKVNSQEEANECAEIANACGEKINILEIKNDFQYFRKDRYQEYFQILQESDNYKTISIQEFRERFGKATEIDWSKANYLDGGKGLIVLSNAVHTDSTFQATVVNEDEVFKNKKGKLIDNFSKIYFKLCTEPITLSN